MNAFKIYLFRIHKIKVSKYKRILNRNILVHISSNYVSNVQKKRCILPQYLRRDFKTLI